MPYNATGVPDCDFFHKFCKQNASKQLKYNSLYLMKKSKDEYILRKLERLMHREYMHQLQTLLLIYKDLRGIDAV